MENSYLNHPLFTDFKSHFIYLDLMIVFPHGAGGTFLSTIMSRSDYIDYNQEVNSLTNEFDVPIGKPLPFDIYDLSTAQANLDVLYRLAEIEKNRTVIPQTWMIGQSHRVPVIAYEIFNMNIAEMLFIEMKPEHRWAISALSVFKHRLNPNWGENPHLIADVANQAIELDSSIRLDDDEYRGISRMMNDSFPWLNINGTPLSWNYYIHTKSVSSVPSADDFRDYLYGLVMHSDFSLYFTDRYQKGKEFFQNEVISYTVDYDDLFFKGAWPSNSRINPTPYAKLIKLYCERNLGLLQKFIDCMDEDHGRVMMQSHIDQWKLDLENAWCAG